MAKQKYEIGMVGLGVMSRNLVLNIADHGYSVSGKTSLIERLNNTIRQRCSRLVRKALSFSKNLANHVGAIWYFIHDYNRHPLAQLGLATTCT